MASNSPAKRLAGRPRNFDRTDALEKAVLLFWKHGYEGVSISNLVDAMGIKAPSLYAAFGSKYELYQEALRHYLDGLGQIGVAALEGAPSAKEGVHNILREAARAFTMPGYPPGCMVGVGSLRCGVENQDAAEQTAALRRMSQSATVARLERAKTDGEIAADTDTEALAAFYAAVIEGLSVQAQDGADRQMLIAIGDLAMKAWPDK